MSAFLGLLAGSAVASAAGWGVFEGLDVLANRATGRGKAADDARMAQAALNRLAGLPIYDTIGDPTGYEFTRASFLADTIGRSNTSLDRAAGRAASATSARDLMFARANQIRASAIATQPHPVELLAGLRSI